MSINKTVRILIFLVLAACLVGAGILDFQRVRAKRLVQSHRNDHHPVINALFAREIAPDQPVDRILTGWSPTRLSRHSNFATLYYVKGDEEPEPCCGGYSTYIYLIAMDGKLVKALAVEGILSEVEYVFFNTLDTAREDKYWASRLQAVTIND